MDEEEQKRACEIDRRARKEAGSMTRCVLNILDQWHMHTDIEWCRKQIKKAAEYANRVPAAKAVLALSEGTSDGAATG